MIARFNLHSVRISLLFKFILGVSLATGIIYYLVVRYINFDYENVAISQSKETARKIAQTYGLKIQTELNGMFHDIRTLKNIYSIFGKVPQKQSRTIFDAAMQKMAYDNPTYLSVWDSWEYGVLNQNYTRGYGRIKTTFFRKGNYIFNVIDSVNFDGDDPASIYYRLKTNPSEFVTEPYFYRLADNQILMASLGCPIFINDKFAGLVGVDIAINDLASMVDTIKPFDEAIAFLLSKEGVIIAHPKRNLIGNNFFELDSLNSRKNNLQQRLNNFEEVEYEHQSPTLKKRLYTIFVPFKLGDTNTIWVLAISMPLNNIIENVETNIREARQTAMLGFILLLLVTIIIAIQIIRPLSKTTKTLNVLAQGDLGNVEKLYINSGDEIETISNSVNKVIQGLKQTYQFAEKIKKGDYNAPFTPLSPKDILGTSILEMRNSLVHADQEKQKRKKEEEQKIWINQGLNHFSVILREDNHDLHKLSANIINNLVNYTQTHSGAIYLTEKSGNQSYLQLYASCGLSKDRMEQTNIRPNEGPIGRCMLEKQTIFMDEIPKDFSYVKSGLGRALPRAILIVPLVVNEELLGVVELESLKPIEEYVVKFVETVATPISSTISTVRINVQTAKLLEESRLQSDELAQQEEEMRQNMEEMQATQEEASKREEEYLKIIESMTNALIYLEYDMSGTITYVNDRLLQVFQLTKDQVVGKKIGSYEFNSKEKTENRIRFWERLASGEVISQEFYSKYLGQDYWLYETYIPIFDQNGDPIKVINIAYDITEEKRKEQQLEKLKAKLERVKASAEKRKESALHHVDTQRTVEMLLEKSSQFKLIRLNHLNKVYKGDIDKIQHILKVYLEAIPSQIEEMRQLFFDRNWFLLKSRTTTFKSKMTYLGIEEMITLAKQIEQFAVMQDIEAKADVIFEEMIDIWENAESEIREILTI
ncbi:MAG TPA: PAS domain-containing protein [Salinivirgaceae bacterium]|nr:PAS domain-containing protein [Salinivirgaceae bacterium]